MLSRAQLNLASFSPKNDANTVTTRALRSSSISSEEIATVSRDEGAPIGPKETVPLEDPQDLGDAPEDLGEGPKPSISSMVVNTELSSAKGPDELRESRKPSISSVVVNNDLLSIKKREVSTTFSTASKRDVSFSTNTPLYDTQGFWRYDPDVKHSARDPIELDSHVKKALDRYKRFVGQPLTYNRSSTSQGLSEVVSNEKLRYMPTQGSKLDQAFKKAEAFVKNFSVFTAGLRSANIADLDGAATITSSCKTLISFVQKNTIGVERTFSGLSESATILAGMAQKVQYMSGSGRASAILQAAFAIMVDVVVDAAASMKGSVRVGVETTSKTFLETRFEVVVTRLTQLKVDFHMELLSQWLLAEGLKEDLKVILRGFNFGLDTCPPSYIHILIEVCSFLHGQTEDNEALKWYRLLWASFEKHRHDCKISTERWFEFCGEYVDVLKTVADWSACIELANDFRAMILADYGAMHHFFVRANLELAALLELDESRYQEAVAIYEAVCGYDTHDFADYEIIIGQVETAKRRLMILFESHEELQHKAEALFLETFFAMKVEHGCAHEKAIVALTRVIDYYQKQSRKAGVTAGVKVIEKYIVDLLAEERDIETLFRVAQSVTKLYRALSSVELGIKFLTALKEQFYYLDGLSAEFSYLEFKQEATLDRRAIAFVSVLEQMLCGYEREGMLDKTIRAIFEETCLYEAWFASQRSTLSIHVRLIAGARLLAHLEREGRHNELLRLRKEMWAIFSALGSSLSTSNSLRELFELCIANATKKTVSIAMLDRLVNVTLESYSRAEYQASLEFLRWSQTLFQQLVVVKHKGVVELAFRISSSISNTVGGSEAHKELHRISSEILIEVMKLGSLDIDFAGISVTQLNVLIRLLGQNKNYLMLERILQYLWDTRMSQNWSGEMTVATGKRLCEVKFAASHYRAAIALLNSICYNLRDVYGPLHRLTVECETLRASFLHKCGQHGDARDIHASILRQIAAAHREQRHDSGDLLGMSREHARRMKWACELAPARNDAEADWTTVLADVHEAFSQSSDIDQGELTAAMDVGGSKQEFNWTIPEDWSLPLEAEV